MLVKEAQMDIKEHEIMSFSEKKVFIEFIKVISSAFFCRMKFRMFWIFHYKSFFVGDSEKSEYSIVLFYITALT